jgi:hypothetical protein
MTQELADQLAKQMANQAAQSAQATAQQSANQGAEKASGKQSVWYCLIAMILSAGLGASALICEDNPQQTFLLVQLLFLVLGIVHVLLMYKFFSWAGQYSMKSELFFSLLVLVLSWVGFFITFYLLKKDFAWLFSAASLTFLLPLLVHWTFIFAIGIPPKEYKKWIYPEKPIVVDMENIDLSNFAVITFIFSKKFGDTNMSNFQSKAPYPIRLGDLFYFFVQEWNYKNPGNTIEYLNPENKPFGWYFYVKKSWWQPKNYLDADATVKENKIAVNAVITTERVNLN